MKASRTVSPPDEHGGADSVKRFADKNGISRAQAYKEIGAGRLTARKVGARTIITHEDAAKWRRALPKASIKDASNIRKPNNDLPVWLLANPRPLQDERPSRRRARPKTPESGPGSAG
jgi:hypothetical protein